MKDKTSEPRYLTLTEVAKLLRLSSVTAVKWAKEGRFVGCSKSGRQWVFREDFGVLEGSMHGHTLELLKRLVPNNKLEANEKQTG